MEDKLTYDLAIVGGGLAGLALSVQIANAGYKVVLFEKEQYPFHRVCGEYISLESWDFLEGLGVDLPSLNVSQVKRLFVSDVKGNSFSAIDVSSLDMGSYFVKVLTIHGSATERFIKN